jgi:aminodeoxyfutalosine synthase
MMTNFSPFEDIHQKVLAGERLNFDDGIRLYRSDDLPVLGALAQIVRERLNGRSVFYSRNLHLNYTNICASDCAFCSFSKKPGEPGGFTLGPDEVGQKVKEEVLRRDINEVHIVGGNNPDLGFDYFLALVARIRESSAEVFIKAFTAVEIAAVAVREGLCVRDVLIRLKEAGLNGLPGGGAEIFAPKIRGRICPDKISAGEWLDIHRTAHEIGLPTNATMLYGHIESDEDRVDHVLRLRELQDRTRGFNAFVPLGFCSEGNRMSGVGASGGCAELKVMAVSRILLDNIPHLKMHWVMSGLKMAQVALLFGVDDLGGTNWEEKIFHEAGSEVPADLPEETLTATIREAGYAPCFVNSSYKETSLSF